MQGIGNDFYLGSPGSDANEKNYIAKFQNFYYVFKSLILGGRGTFEHQLFNRHLLINYGLYTMCI